MGNIKGSISNSRYSKGNKKYHYLMTDVGVTTHPFINSKLSRSTTAKISELFYGLWKESQEDARLPESSKSKISEKLSETGTPAKKTKQFDENPGYKLFLMYSFRTNSKRHQEIVRQNKEMYKDIRNVLVVSASSLRSVDDLKETESNDEEVADQMDEEYDICCGWKMIKTYNKNESYSSKLLTKILEPCVKNNNEENEEYELINI